MRAIGLAAAILLLAGCGGSSEAEVRYDVKSATNCIRHAQPAETGRSMPAEYPSGFGVAFGDDHYSYLSYMLAVGYGPDRATATRNEPRLLQRIRRHRAWGRRDGNVVYDAFGPIEQFRLEKRPPGLTVTTIRRLAHAASERMRMAITGCLAKARIGVRRSALPTQSPPAPAAS